MSVLDLFQLVPAADDEILSTIMFRGRRSRNKVSVGEPAEGSLWNLIFISDSGSCEHSSGSFIMFDPCSNRASFGCSVYNVK